MKQQNDLISVIVPVYNTNEYLCKCVESIIAQTYENLEIILVDDGSTDESGKICDEYAKKDSRIKVIHKANGGQASARNIGLDIASGEYIAFVDSDDYIKENMYETLYQAIKTDDYDIAMCGRFKVRGDKISKSFCLDEPVVMDSYEALRQFCLANYVDSSACDKLMRKQVIGDIRFPEAGICEDVEFVFRVFANMKKMIHCGVPLYCYLQREGSTSRSAFAEKSMGLYIYHENAYKYIKSLHPTLEKEAQSMLYTKAITLYLIMVKCGYRDEKKKFIKSKISENLLNIITNGYIPFVTRIIGLLISCSIYDAARKLNLIRKKLFSHRTGK